MTRYPNLLYSMDTKEKNLCLPQMLTRESEKIEKKIKTMSNKYTNIATVYHQIGWQPEKPMGKINRINIFFFARNL